MDVFLDISSSEADHASELDVPYSLTSTPMKPNKPRFSGCFQTKHSPVRQTVISSAASEEFLEKHSATESILNDLDQSKESRAERLRSLSFRRQRLELRLERLQTRTHGLRLRDQQIKRRHSELHHHRTILSSDNRVTSIDHIQSDMPSLREKRPRLSPAETVHISVLLNDDEEHFLPSLKRRETGRTLCSVIDGKLFTQDVNLQTNENVKGLEISSPKKNAQQKSRKRRLRFKNFLQKRLLSLFNK